jgi:exodeoxyribonuclease V alpha subunit
VVFEKRDKSKPAFSCPLSKLPEHSPAWAITIHRSQGSEYDNVVVILPRKAESPLATRELLYTAITRAKKNLFVFGPEEVIRQAILCRSHRTTLMEWQLERLSQKA